jgi:hypothetical protein
VTVILRAIAARRSDDLERQRVVAYELAGLVAVGFHNPKNMPEYKPLAQKRAKTEANTPADDEHARGFLMLLALRSQQ